MLIICPACHEGVDLKKLQCQKCKGIIDVDENMVPDSPVAICPACGARQKFSRLQCPSCRAPIDVASALPQGTSAAATPKQPVRAAPRPQPQQSESDKAVSKESASYGLAAKVAIGVTGAVLLALLGFAFWAFVLRNTAASDHRSDVVRLGGDPAAGPTPAQTSESGSADSRSPPKPKEEIPGVPLQKMSAQFTCPLGVLINVEFPKSVVSEYADTTELKLVDGKLEAESHFLKETHSVSAKEKPVWLVFRAGESMGKAVGADPKEYTINVGDAAIACLGADIWEKDSAKDIAAAGHDIVFQHKASRGYRRLLFVLPATAKDIMVKYKPADGTGVSVSAVLPGGADPGAQAQQPPTYSDVRVAPSENPPSRPSATSKGASTTGGLDYCTLTDAQSGEYTERARKAGMRADATGFSLGNIFDNTTNTMILSDAEIAKVRAVGGRYSHAEMVQRDKRLGLLKDMTQAVGVEKLRKVGITILVDGQAKYAWPPPTSTELSGKGSSEDHRPKPNITSGSKSKATLPPFTVELQGSNPLRVRNPNDFAVTVGIRAGGKGKDFDVPPNGVQAVNIPDGKYDIYFVYSDKPDALFQGDSFTLNGNGVEIRIVKVVNGNYGIRQVK